MSEEFDFSQFDMNVSPETLDAIAKAESGHTEYEEIPDGEYEVIPERIQQKLTKKDSKPMVSIRFRIMSDGAYKNRLMFANYVFIKKDGTINTYAIHKCKKLVSSLDPEFTAGFESFTQWADCMKVEDYAVCGNAFYILTKKTDSKGFTEYTIGEDMYQVPDGYTKPIF